MDLFEIQVLLVWELSEVNTKKALVLKHDQALCSRYLRIRDFRVQDSWTLLYS